MIALGLHLLEGTVFKSWVLKKILVISLTKDLLVGGRQLLECCEYYITFIES